jgi:hypothetical protein
MKILKILHLTPSYLKNYSKLKKKIPLNKEIFKEIKNEKIFKEIKIKEKIKEKSFLKETEKNQIEEKVKKEKNKLEENIMKEILSFGQLNPKSNDIKRKNYDLNCKEQY